MKGPSRRGSLLRFLAEAGGEKPWLILIPKEIPQLSGQWRWHCDNFLSGN